MLAATKVMYIFKIVAFIWAVGRCMRWMKSRRFAAAAHPDS